MISMRLIGQKEDIPRCFILCSDSGRHTRSFFPLEGCQCAAAADICSHGSTFQPQSDYDCPPS